MPRKRTIIGSLLLLQGLGMALGYAVQVLVARTLGPAEYGLYRHAFSWMMILAWAASLGFPTSLQRFVPEYLRRNEPGLFWGLYRAVTTLPLLVGTILGLALSAIPTLLPHDDSSSWSNGRLYFYSAAFVVPVVALFLTHVHFLRALRRHYLAFIPFHFLRPLGHGLGGIAAAITSPIFLLPSYAAVLATGTLIQRVLLRRRPPLPPTTPVSLTTFWLRVSFPMLVINLAGVLNAQLAVIIGGSVLSPQDVATISVAIQIGMIPTLITSAIETVVAPEVSGLYYGNQRAAAQRILAKSTLAATGATLPTVATLWVGIPYILRLYGPSFATPTAIITTRIFLFPPLAYSIAGLAGVYLNVTGRQKTNAALYLVTMAVTMLAAIVAGAHGGLLPLAAVYAAGRSFVFLVASIAVWYITGTDTTLLAVRFLLPRSPRE